MLASAQPSVSRLAQQGKSEEFPTGRPEDGFTKFKLQTSKSISYETKDIFEGAGYLPAE